MMAFDIEYWTTSTCATCGVDGRNLTYARMNNLRVKLHIVVFQPDATVQDAASKGHNLPFFTDGKGHYWDTSRDYMESLGGH